MKKKALLVVFVAAALFIGYSAYNVQNKVTLAGVILANVEALADDAGEATEVGTCYVEQSFASSRAYKSFCDKQTDDSHIYPCPTRQIYGGFSSMCTDRCTK